MGKYEDLKVEYARLEEKVAHLQKQVEQLSSEKAKVEQELLKVSTSAALANKELEDLRKKMRESTNDALGTVMELERVRKEYNELIARVKDLTTGGSGILTDLGEVIKIIKEKISRAKHNVRLVLPRLTDFDQHKFLAVFEKLPPVVVTHVAAAVDTNTPLPLIASLQEKHIQVTNYQALNEYAVVVDGEECVIALVDPKNPEKVLGGLYTNLIGLTSLLVDAIQVAFVKGTKVPPVHRPLVI